MGQDQLMKAWIQRDALSGILGAFVDAGGAEPCGVLLGKLQGGAVRIDEAPAAPNTHPRPSQAFLIAPQDLLAVVRDARQRGLTIVGFWHGHLTGPPDPGQDDLDGLAAVEAYAPSARVLVIAGRGAGRNPVVRAWTRGEEGAHELPLAT